MPRIFVEPTIMAAVSFVACLFVLPTVLGAVLVACMVWLGGSIFALFRHGRTETP